VRIKVDEDLPRAVTALRVTAGYTDTMSVTDQRMGGWPDTALWEAVQKEGRFLVTADKGFADARSHPPGGHAGVLLLRPDADGLQPLIDLLRRVLAAGNISTLEGTVSVATPRGVRTRWQASSEGKR
jgi:predicted nuclease of predicted toxin-antitoxin system